MLDLWKADRRFVDEAMNGLTQSPAGAQPILLVPAPIALRE
jgi:hypothetical protein